MPKPIGNNKLLDLFTRLDLVETIMDCEHKQGFEFFRKKKATCPVCGEPVRVKFKEIVIQLARPSGMIGGLFLSPVDLAEIVNNISDYEDGIQ